MFTSGDHYRTHNNFIRDTKAERLSDIVEFQHKSITRPAISHADCVINALGAFVNSIKSMTKGATAGAKKNGVNMKDLHQLAEVTSRITTNLPDIAECPAPSTRPNPLSMVYNKPTIELLRRSPRLKQSADATIAELQTMARNKESPDKIKEKFKKLSLIQK